MSNKESMSYMVDKDIDLIYSYVSENCRGIEIKKGQLAHLFRISHNRASRIWNILPEKGFIVNRTTIMLPFEDEMEQAVEDDKSLGP